METQRRLSEQNAILIENQKSLAEELYRLRHKDEESIFRTLIRYGFNSTVAYAILSNSFSRYLLFSAIQSSPYAIMGVFKAIGAIFPPAQLPLALYGAYKGYQALQSFRNSAEGAYGRLRDFKRRYIGYYDGHMVYDGEVAEELHALDSMLTEGLSHYYHGHFDYNHFRRVACKMKYGHRTNEASQRGMAKCHEKYSPKNDKGRL